MAISPTHPSKTVQVLTYNGKSFVTGLLWHPLGSLNGYMREARQFGRQERLDIVAIRHTQSIIQAGFVARSAGAVKGMYSLASTLAGQLGASWLAAWKINTEEERYALVAVYEGAVIPGYDLVGTAEEIQRKIKQIRSRLTFEQSYFPVEFDADAKQLNIEELLSPVNLRREFQLRPLAFGLSSNELMRLGAVFAVLLCALLGWQQWSAYKAKLLREAEIAAEKKRQAELEELSLRAKQAQTLQALEHPWAKRPSANDFVEGCNGTIDKLPLSISGWMFSKAVCNGDAVTATYKRLDNSTSDGFILATKGHFSGEPLLDSAGNSVDVKVMMKLPLAGDSELQDAQVAMPHLTSWLHAQSLAPSVKEVQDVIPQPQALPGQPAAPAPAAPDWKHYQIDYASQLPPTIALRGVPDIGLRLNEIKTELQNHQLNWTVKGDLYAK